MTDALKADETLTTLREEAEAGSEDPRFNTKVYIRSGVLLRNWLPPHLSTIDEGWAENNQLVP